MAIISMLCGSVLGMLSALTSLIFLDASWLMALGIWSLSGAAMSLGLLAMAMMPQRVPSAGMARHAACGFTKYIHRKQVLHVAASA